MRFLLLALALPITAQTAPPQGAAAAEAMSRFAFLEGHWKGEGSMFMGPGRKVTFQQTEIVAFRAGGTALAVEGTGVDQGRPVHQAFGVLWYDAASQGYKMRSWLSNGLSRDFSVVLKSEGSGYTWGWEDPRAGKIRYAMNLTADGKWVETGERSTDGATWTPFLEMKLTKQ